ANPHILSSNTVRTIAQKYKKTEAQIFFRYLSQSSIVPLTGTSSEQHMREDLSIFNFELSSEDLKNVGLLLN
ncbi:MAG: aldo/keto reductase, partial [Deltaproteobacteria bacterium]|nr:aldo/keto reductase [Deltaproteobacteria bacterium]